LLAEFVLFTATINYGGAPAVQVAAELVPNWHSGLPLRMTFVSEGDAANLERAAAWARAGGLCEHTALTLARDLAHTIIDKHAPVLLHMTRQLLQHTRLDKGTMARLLAPVRADPEPSRACGALARTLAAIPVPRPDIPRFDVRTRAEWPPSPRR
jgi:hypothetical protein